MPRTLAEKAELAVRIKNDFQYHQPTEKAKELHALVNDNLGDVAILIGGEIPNCREASLFLTKMEEARYYANAAIARNHDKL